MESPEAIQDLRNLKIWHRRRLWQPFMEKYDCQAICEVGVFSGENFMRLIDHKPKLAVAVDAWAEDGNPAHNDGGYSRKYKENQYANFCKDVADKPFVKILRTYSHQAASLFPDEHFDLIYIDGDHTYEGCRQDLEDWFPKVKTGKFFIGDDYSDSFVKKTNVQFGVIPAVNEFARKQCYEVHLITENGWVIIK